MLEFWNIIFVNPIFNVLVGIYSLTQNLGVSIILLTILIRTLLLPIVLPSFKAMKKQRDLQPEIEKLKAKYGTDKKKLAEKQLELFQKHGINPVAGCLPQVLMIIVLIALYGVIMKFSNGVVIADLNNLIYFDFLKFPLDAIINTRFLYLDLAKSDPYYIFAVLSGAIQFLVSKMLMPYNVAGQKAAAKTPDKADDIAYNVQNQMLYMAPILTVIIGISLPAGAVLYIFTTTVFSLVQQYFATGLGGLTPWVEKLGIIKNGKN